MQSHPLSFFKKIADGLLIKLKTDASTSSVMVKISNKSLTGYTFIDLFAGIGGFRLALESFGAHCVYSNEWDSFAQKTYQKNFGDMPEGDITKVNRDY